MLKISLVILLVFTITISAQQHHSFASTKFDLSPDLPVEEPVKINAQVDQKPESQPQHKHHEIKPVEAIPTASSSLPNVPQRVETSTSQPPQPQTLVPLRTLAPIAPAALSVTPQTLAPFTPFTLAPIPSSGPIGFQAPFPPQQQQFGPFVPPQQQNIQNQGFQPLPRQEAQIIQPQRGPNVQLIQEAVITERVDLWFRENYDTRICKRDSRYLANQFRLKFPPNLWRGGKEVVLADLLSARLNDCFTKQDSNHWRRVDELILGLNLATTEEEECRTGLIQEQISCDNVFSYTCQFIQKAYNFRLVPTRLIIQESRIAENGAEKCRKIVRKIKKELEG